MSFTVFIPLDLLLVDPANLSATTENFKEDMTGAVSLWAVLYI
jgi:hypothetical protein